MADEITEVLDISETAEDIPQEGGELQGSDAPSAVSLSETEDTEPDNADTQGEENVEALRAELQMLRRELDEKNVAFERMKNEIDEFSELFPERNVNTLPDSVWGSVREGIPLAAAYALYERREAQRRETASRTNAKNGERSTGALGRECTESFYTPDEVRAMSRSEVRKNYSKIIESMKKWN